MGRHQLRLLRFALDYPGWHSIGTDPAPLAAMRALQGLGLLEVAEHPRPARPQFRIRQPSAS